MQDDHPVFVNDSRFAVHVGGGPLLCKLIYSNSDLSGRIKLFSEV